MDNNRRTPPGAHEFWPPTAPLSAIRSIFSHAVITGLTLEQIDVENVYPQVPRGTGAAEPYGPLEKERFVLDDFETRYDGTGLHFLQLDKSAWPFFPPEATEKLERGGSQALFEMTAALYGHPGGGKMFVEECLRVLKAMGWQAMSGSAAILRKGHSRCAAYVGDLIASGCRTDLAALWAGVVKRFTIEDPHPVTLMLGMEIEYTGDQNQRTLYIGRKRHANMIAESYQRPFPNEKGRTGRHTCVRRSTRIHRAILLEGQYCPHRRSA